MNTVQCKTTGKVVELKGYVIILVETKEKKIKLYGSPAEKDNLEVADEILDVNETKLEDMSRADVIRHIHECIQSCMIKLRVKRRSDMRLVEVHLKNPQNNYATRQAGCHISLCIEADVLCKIDYKDLIKDFAKKKYKPEMLERYRNCE